MITRHVSASAAIALLAISVTGCAAGGTAAPATSAVAPSPSPPYTWPARLAPGTYTTKFAWDVPFTVTLTVPTGWESRDIEVIKEPRLGVAFHIVDNVYDDTCMHVPMAPKIGPTVDALALAISRLKGIDATTPRAVKLAGFTGKYVELSVRSDVGCRAQDLFLWDNPPASIVHDRGPLGPLVWGAEQVHQRVWVLDVRGMRYVISAQSAPDATPAELAELQKVIDSIRID